jgi:3-hydroxyisobutyrate dehydrogenase-like beta-hydroxyacid dehydrogenase
VGRGKAVPVMTAMNPAAMRKVAEDLEAIGSTAIDAPVIAGAGRG